MPSDYEWIRKDNIERRGTEFKDIGDFIARQLYSDRTHFVFELLQNAEDAGATHVEFELTELGLLFRHNGRPFNEADVRAVCDVLRGTKAGDAAQIGRFGIGFKSVYAFTTSPEIHSGDEHFRINDYIRPAAATLPHADRPLRADETLICLPFNRSDEPVQNAFAQVADRLRRLGPRTLLFLAHLREIAWHTLTERGTYLREGTTIGPTTRVTVTDASAGSETVEQWLVFKRPVQDSAQPSSAPLAVEVAFRTHRPEGGRERIVATPESRLIVFFPTEKETHFGFLAQGPYRTTPARDNIVAGDSWNEMLVRETATLVTDTLPLLRAARLLTVNLLETLPIRTASFPPGSTFRPIFDAVRDALKSGPVLPAAGNTYVPATRAMLARGAAIRELLSGEQLQALFALAEPAAWLTGQVSQARTPDLWLYVTQQLGVREVTPETFSWRVDKQFLTRQPDEWMVRFYRFLAGDQSALWQPPKGRTPAGPLRSKPILRLANDHHTAPFDSNGDPAAFLAAGTTNNVPVVKPSLIVDDEIRGFLQRLGLTEPDLVAEVIEHTLPKYVDEERDIAIAEHDEDVRLVQRALLYAQPDARGRLLGRLRDTPFIACEANTDGRPWWDLPVNVHERTADLEAFFGTAHKIHYLAERVDLGTFTDPRDIRAASATRVSPTTWRDLGVANKPRLNRGAFGLTEKQKSALRSDARFSQEELDNTDMEGLQPFLKRLLTLPADDARKQARLLWDFLIAHLKEANQASPGSVFSGTYRWQFYNWNSIPIESTLLRRLRKAAWLPDPLGKLHRPAEISADDLPADFERNPALNDALQLRPAAVAALAAEIDISVELIDLIRHERELFQEVLAEVQARLSKRPRGPGPTSAPDTEFEFRPAFKKVFNKPATAPTSEPVPAPEPVGNPALRKSRVAGEIAELRKNEPPPTSRFHRVPRQVWEAKDSTIRVTLANYYNGRCQICDMTFAKRDGKPYFEGLYLVPRIGARWIDRPGNVLCLCANCCAKFQFGPVEVEDDLLGQIEGYRHLPDRGSVKPTIRVTLCGAPITIRFSEAHMIDLQQLLNA